MTTYVRNARISIIDSLLDKFKDSISIFFLQFNSFSLLLFLSMEIKSTFFNSQYKTHVKIKYKLETLEMLLQKKSFLEIFSNMYKTRKKVQKTYQVDIE